MAKDFGKTWWGDAWLQSLTNIDYANRIPRGARYARNGSVRKIAIKDNVIGAKVQGSRFTPYSVKIEVNKFSRKPQIRNYAPNMIQKRKKSASLVKRGHSASNVTIKTYKCPLPHHAT